MLHPLGCAKATLTAKLVAHGCSHLLCHIICGTWNTGVLDLACPYVVLITSGKDHQRNTTWSATVQDMANSLLHDPKGNPHWELARKILIHSLRIILQFDLADGHKKVFELVPIAVGESGLYLMDHSFMTHYCL